MMDCRSKNNYFLFSRWVQLFAGIFRPLMEMNRHRFKRVNNIIIEKECGVLQNESY